MIIERHILATKAIQLFKNNSKNKQSIFKDWEKLKHNITFIHPQSEKHHLRVVGGFQFQVINQMMNGESLD